MKRRVRQAVVRVATLSREYSWDAIRDLVAVALQYPIETVKQMLERVIAGKPGDEADHEALVELALGKTATRV